MALFFGLSTTAQTDFLSNLVQQQLYYDSLITVLGADSMQGTGYTQYKRWYSYWAPKLNSNYDFDDYQTDLLAYTRNYTNTQDGSTPNWRLIGPNDIPAGGSSAKGTGQIHYIYKDTHDETGNTIYACSPVGGLFKSVDNGDTWINSGTDKGLPRPGVSSVVVDSRAANTLYVSTGDGEGFDWLKAWQTAIGVYRTTDNCASWQFIGLDTADNKNIYHMRKIIEIDNQTDSTNLIVTTTEGLYETKNANGVSPEWNKLIDGEFYDVIQDLSNNNIIYASGSNSTGIYKYNLSTNDSIKIFDIDTITLPYDTMVIREPKFRRISLKISPADSNYLFAVISMRDYNYTVIYRYDISAQNWHRLYAPSGFNGYARKFGWTIRPEKNNNDEIQILGQDAFSLLLISNGLSNDTSAVYTKIDDIVTEPHDDFHYLLIEDNDNVIWAATDGGIYKGEFVNDTTISWESKNKGLGVATIQHIDVSSSGKLITSGQFDCGSNIYETPNETDWDAKIRYGGDGYQTIIVNDDNYFVSAQNGSVREYINGNMNPIYMGLYYKKNASCTNIDTLAFGNWATYYVRVEDILYGAGNNGIKRYNGEWNLWTDFQNQIGCAIPGTWRVAAMKKTDGVHQIYTSSRQEGDSSYHYLYKSIDGGGTGTNKWVKINNTPAEGFISSIKITTNPDSVLVSIQKQIFSVNTSNPSVPVWYNITHNLIAGNINSIDIETELGNHKIWIATEHGVHYMEDGTNTWVNYTTNLPNCEVKDIKVKNNKVYVGTYGRGVWFASAPSCGNPGGTYTINSQNNVIISGTHREHYTNVIVPTGFTYTIYGTLSMGADCKIIVERGAKLVVDGGTLTKACPDLWGGIDVWGTSDAPQNDTVQGWVTLKNATIEYSKDGISTIKDVHGINLSYTGGVIQADSTTFLNNSRSIAMYRYPYEDRTLTGNNESYFKNCTFTYDSSYYYLDDSPRQHVNLSEVRGVLFESNVFENTVSPSFAYGTDRGVGLLSNNSGYFLLKYENATHGNIFDGLNYGVRSLAFYQTNRSIVVDQNEFNHNRTGAYFSAETFLSIIRNSFIITTGTIELPNGYSGLYLDACTGYQVEENAFYSNYDPVNPTSYSKCTGLIINNSGSDDNFIYKNNFSNISYATLAQNHNRDINGHKGLQYKCNNFENNYMDIAVTWNGDPSSYNGIAESQGSKADSLIAPAGNLFSQRGASSYSDFENQGEDVIYYMPNWELNDDYRILPEYSDPDKVHPSYNNTLDDWNPIVGCPSHLSTKTMGELSSLIAANESNRSIYTDSLIINVDNGNTIALGLDVVTSIPPETMVLRDELLAASPYLSDTVMVNAAEKEDVLPNSIITEILVSNPQSSRAENVLSTLDNRNSPPNANQMSSIYANDTVIGAKEILESKVSFYSSQKHKNVNDLVRLFLVDSIITININDSIESVLGNMVTPTSYYLQSFCRYSNNDSAGVLNKLADVTSNFDLTSHETDIHIGFEDYFNIMLNLQSQNAGLEGIDSIQKNQIATIMQNSGGLVQSYCRNILINADDFVYNKPYIYPDTTSTKSTRIININNNFYDNNSEYIKLYPNPANEYIVMNYRVPYKSDIIITEIITLTGTHIKTFKLNYTFGEKIIDIRDFNTGTYIIRLWADGKVVESSKFVKL